VFAEHPNRNLPDRLLTYADDVDRASNDAHTFFYDVAYNAAKRGLHYVFVALPKGEYNNLAEAKRSGHRPYFVSIDCRNVIDADLESDNPYVVIRNVYNKSLGAFLGYELVKEYTVWYSDRWEKYQDNGKDDVIKIDEGSNYLGFVPIIPFYFRKKDTFIGVSAINDVDELIVNLFRKDSELDYSLFNSAVPMLFMTNVTTEESQEFVKSPENAFASNQAGSDAKYIEPTGVSFEWMTNNINKLENSIREIALKSFRKETAAAESAVSKKMDRKQLDNLIYTFAKNLEDAEELCWYFFDILNGGDGSEIEIKYTSQFDIEEISDVLIKTLEDMTIKNLLSKETLYKVLKDNKILPEDFDSVEESQKLTQQSYNLNI
jgi:hypothetical protein